MKYDRILIKQNFLLNPLTMEHRHIGVEIQLDEFDNPDECYLKAKAKIQEWAESELGFEQVADNKPLPVMSVDKPTLTTDVIENDALKQFWADQMKKKLSQ